MKIILLTAIAALLTTMVKAKDARAGFKVWAVNDGEKVKRDELDHPSRRRNSAWDGRRVKLFGARNEFVAFQVMVVAERSPLTVKSVELRFGLEALDREVEIFSEHYIDVPTPSTVRNGWFWRKVVSPRIAPGSIPDALVPLHATPGRGGLPIDIEKKKLQGFWVDIYIPKPIVAGAYDGELTIETDRGVERLPVKLEIISATLPDKDLIKIMVAMSGQGAYKKRHGRDDSKLAKLYNFMAHRHRFDPVHGWPLKTIKEYEPYLTGAAYTRANGYHGPAEGLGHRVFPVDMYGWGDVHKQKDAEGWQRMCGRWVRWFEKHAPDVLYFFYLEDEPPPARFPELCKLASRIHDAPGPGKRMPVMLTKAPHPGLAGAVDIWATVADQVDLKKMAEERKEGRRWWFYNGMRPCSGAVPFDAPAIDMRVQSWICWLYDVELWFYWEGTHWRHNHQGPRAHKDQNVWSDPFTFVTDKIKVCGDGTLYYPGEDAIFKDQDRGIKGPISSIRMKNIRRGQQDVAYIQLAIGVGKEEAARAVASELISAAFGDARGMKEMPWPEDGDAWEEARRELAGLITGK